MESKPKEGQEAGMAWWVEYGEDEGYEVREMMRWEYTAFQAIVGASFILRGLGRHWQVLSTEVTWSQFEKGGQGRDREMSYDAIAMIQETAYSDSDQ